MRNSNCSTPLFSPDNSPDPTHTHSRALSGSVAGIEEAFAACTAAGLKSIVVPHIQRAYHSPDTYCMRESFMADMDAMHLPHVSWRATADRAAPQV